MLAIINISGNFIVLVVHTIAVVFVTIQTTEDLIITGTDVAVTALIPFSGMGTVENGKDGIMLDKLGRFPGIKTVALLTLLAETSPLVIRTGDGVIIFLVARITLGL